MACVGSALRAVKVALAVFGATLAAPTIANAQSTYLPSIKIGTAALIAPVAANTYYYSKTGWTDTNVSDGLSGLTGVETPTPPEIIELARALHYDPDLIYQYVHNNIQTVWMYGLQKGALGAEIDKSGTPFDQAELMMALLRQSNITASYVAGTVQFNQAQFSAWTGITNARAACQLLANGGIPATVNGTNNAVCSAIADTAQVSTIEMADIWLKVTISGTAYVFDPGYKNYNYKTGIPLATAMGFSSGTPLNDATTGGGYTTGADSGVSYALSLNAGALNTDLQNYASNLLSYIKTNNYQGLQIEDIIGGGVIVPDNSTLRQTTLPYADPTPPYVFHTWTPPADAARYNAIPDQYRTTLTVEGKTSQYQLVSGVWQLEPVEMFNPTQFFADEIYGRRLTVETDFTAAGIPTQAAYNYQRACIALDAQPWNTWPAAQCLVRYDYGPPGGPYSQTTPRGIPANILLSANHPYAASADGTATTNGDYMDASLNKPVSLITPLTIIHGWGDVSPALLSKWSDERPSEAILPQDNIAPLCPGEAGQEGETCALYYQQPTGGFAREKTAAGWMAQFSRAARLNAQLAGAVPQVHHLLGVVFGDAALQGISQVPQTPPGYVIGDDFDRLDVDAGLSFTSTKTSTAASNARRGGIMALAAASATLEGSMAAQMADLPDTSSTATRFEWGNSPDSDHTPSGQNPFGIGAQKFYQYTQANSGQSGTLSTVDGGATGSCNNTTGYNSWGAPPTFTATQCAGLTASLASWISRYAQQGFSVVASREAFLGPGQRGGTFEGIPGPSGLPDTYTHDVGRQRGGAFVALLTDGNGDPIQIAHIIIGGRGITKGGGGGTQPDSQTTYNPGTAADILKSKFVDRSKLLGVDLANGSLGSTSPVSVSIGNGGFPYELSANLSWHPGASPVLNFGPQSPIVPQPGWDASWLNTMSFSGSGMEAMGQSDIRGAIGAIVSFYAAQDIYQSSPSIAREVAGVLTQAWWAHQLSGNVVTVNVGGSTRQFLRIATGDWIQPGAGYATAVQTNARVPYEEKCFHVNFANPPYALSRGWDASNVSFSVTNAQGDIENFGYFINPYETDDFHQCGRLKGFRLTSWTFPYGTSTTPMAITPTYTPVFDGTDTFDTLTAVSNSIGRSLSFGTGTINGMSFGFNADGSFSVTDALTNKTTYTFQPPQPLSTTQRPVPYPLLASVTTPDATQHNTEWSYDSLGRIETVKDAVAIQQGGRNPYSFLIADGTRGERDDPLSQAYTVVYDTYGHVGRYIDEIGHETDAVFDSRGRAVQFVYPEGDCEAFAYDDHNNTTDFWKVDKTSACNTGAGATHVLHASATWDQTWNKPTLVTDARGNMTTLVYYPTGSTTGTSLIETATLPDINIGTPDEGQPVYSFDYDAFGRLADETTPTLIGQPGIVTHNDYDSTTHYLSDTIRDYSTGSGHLNLKTQFLYDLVGNVYQVYDPRGNATTTVWDANRRRVEDDHHIGNAFANINAAEKTLYDAVNRVTDNQVGTAFSGTSVTAWLTTKHTTYTPTSKVATVTDADIRATTTAYDNGDRVLTVTDPLSRKVHFAYCGSGNQHCAANQVKTEWRSWVSGTGCTRPGSLQECYRRVTYGADGEQASIEDANNNITTYGYDGWNRLTTTTFPDTTFEQLVLDANGNATSRTTRAGQQITYVFNALNKVQEKTVVATGLDTKWQYILDGRIDILSDNVGSNDSIDYSYDTAGRMKAVTTFQPDFGGHRIVNYKLDANGNRIQLTWPTIDGGDSVGYCYDNLNRMTLVQDNATDCTSAPLATYAYDALSRRSSVTYGNGASMTYPTYTNAGDLETLTHTFPGGTSNNNTFSYTYTNAHETQSVAASNGAFFWQPPPISNSTSYTPNNLNQYAAIGSQTTGGTNCSGAAQGLSYDCNGNLTFDGTFTYTYDAENRLLTANKTAGGTVAATYLYDPLGRRTKKYGTGVTTTYFLNDGTDELAEYDSTKTITRRIIPGPSIDEPVAVVDMTTGTKSQRSTSTPTSKAASRP